MRPNDRRNRIIELLSFRRHETLDNLAHEFGVSRYTIMRDIVQLQEKYSTVAKCWRVAGCAAIPVEQAGRSRKSLAPFSLGSTNAHPLHRLRCRRSAYVLRSQQPRTTAAPQCTVEHTRTSNSDFRHAGSSRRFQPHGTAFGAGNLSPLASFPSRFSV